jgi:hypothetical protein
VIKFLKNAWSWLKNAWNYLDGKKTIIAATFWTIVMPTLNIIYPNGIPATLNKTTIIFGTFLSSIGLGHKAIKKFASSDDDAMKLDPIE